MEARVRGDRIRMVLATLGAAPAAALHFFFPPICHVCLERLAPTDNRICRWCREELLPLPGPVCPWCGVGGADIKADRCGSCPRPRHFEAARGAVRYNPTVRDLIHEFKFRKHVELAPLMGDWCHEALEAEWPFEDFDAIVPVPLFSARLRQRGFNQADQIARTLQDRSGLPLATEFLERIRPTQTQSSLDTHRQRVNNVKGAFYSDPRSGVRGRRVVLVDDVMTSGSTVNECARALKEGGAASVHVLTFARAGKGKPLPPPRAPQSPKTKDKR